MASTYTEATLLVDAAEEALVVGGDDPSENSPATAATHALDPKPRRRYGQLPVLVVENHNEVVPHLYRAMGSRHLPLEGNTIVHLDSHPDLGVPPSMPADTVFDKEALFGHISIESWLLPACFAGHFRNILWLRPPWSKQFPDGVLDFRVGRHNQSGEIRVDSAEQYFLGSAMFAPLEQLEAVREVRLVTLTLGQYVQDEGPEDDEVALERHLRQLVPSDSQGAYFVLDVDLDFFSTKNPFVDMFPRAELYKRLAPLYAYTTPSVPEEAEEMAQRREAQLEELSTIFRHVNQRGGSLEGLPIDSARVKAVKELVNSVHAAYPLDEERLSLDWEIVHDAGCTLDNGNDLPHHVSSDEQIAELVERSLSAVLRALPSPPTFVTLARSSEDDYTPPEAVDLIQDAVIAKLLHFYPDAEIKKDYDAAC
ncbi:UPF0489 protein C5orf22 homolog isoform X3 [Neocloeon triangulifer]|uniref:UPF0489 protein C5orf22 homolog isoform X3 n=1 Tax=Neocloeon triangulifer TaxID=2078957 RepID=UPI00286F90E6|nr:UPF0489 protein C5orf22 homolog isoform X3 [Neocloeon triangulifer]